MKKEHQNNIKSCWSFRFEFLGLILLVIATLLTILTLNSIGIAAMFLVGMILYCYKHFSCHTANYDPREDEKEIERLLSNIERNTSTKNAAPSKKTDQPKKTSSAKK